MPDTGFLVPEAKLDRLASIYRTDRDGGLQKLPEGPLEEGHVVFSSTYPYRGPRRYQSGGAGLVSTAPDYARFAQMLLNGGELDGVRLLGRKTVELMTTDHITRVAENPAMASASGSRWRTTPGARARSRVRGRGSGAAFTPPASGSTRARSSSA